MITDFTPEELAVLDAVPNWEEFFSVKPAVERIKEGHYKDSFIVEMLLRDRIVSQMTFFDELGAIARANFALFDELEAKNVTSKEFDEQWEPHRMTYANAAASLPSDHGVCDTPEQVLEKWPQLATDPRRFIIFFTEVRREHQSERQGWRWEKWGPYIGTKDSQAEYLYDEPEIESVLVFQVLQMKPVS